MKLAGNIGLAAALAIVVTGTAVAIAASWGGAYFLPGALAGTLAGVAALLRHRGRLRAAVAGLTVAVVAVSAALIAGLPAEPGPAVSLALAVLVGSVTRVEPLRAAAWIAAASLAVIAVGAFAHPGESGAFAVTMFGALAWAAGLLIGVGLRLLDARRLAAVEAVRRDERLTIARELHDVVAHYVTGIVVQAQAAQLVARRDPVKAGKTFADIEAAGAEALAAVRRVVGVLRDDAGDGADGWDVSVGQERIADLVWRFERIGPPVHLELPADEDRWPVEVAGAVHRVVQESLTNVARHAAHARSVTVVLSESEGTVMVRVADDGEGAPPPAHSGYGIVGMRERVEALGGTLSAGPAPGGGWQVQGTLPLPGHAVALLHRPSSAPSSGPLSSGASSSPSSGSASSGRSSASPPGSPSSGPPSVSPPESAPSGASSASPPGAPADGSSGSSGRSVESSGVVPPGSLGESMSVPSAGSSDELSAGLSAGSESGLSAGSTAEVPPGESAEGLRSGALGEWPGRSLPGSLPGSR
ncbi:histidine kinase [Dactylosporangium sp. NPDC049742]|uniref:sensor histidine kinase n=1 Tax=Dactylosporangium sp. NPDC049742 TaxID=3154737 RepID=UPI00341E8787